MAFDKKISEALDKVVVESRTPKLGIWWLVDNKVISFQEEFRDVPPVGPSRDSDFMHYSEFPKLKLRGEYTDYPRGRVIYLEGPQRFAILGSKAMMDNKEALIKIAKDFSLPASKIALMADSHYEI